MLIHREGVNWVVACCCAIEKGNREAALTWLETWDGGIDPDPMLVVYSALKNNFPLIAKKIFRFVTFSARVLWFQLVQLAILEYQSTAVLSFLKTEMLASPSALKKPDADALWRRMLDSAVRSILIEAVRGEKRRAIRLCFRLSTLRPNAAALTSVNGPPDLIWLLASRALSLSKGIATEDPATVFNTVDKIDLFLSHLTSFANKKNTARSHATRAMARLLKKQILANLEFLPLPTPKVER